MNTLKYLVLSLITPSICFGFTPSYSLKDLGLLKGTDRAISGQINDRGDSTGTAIADNDRAILFRKGKVIDLVPGAASSLPGGINRRGEVAGSFTNSAQTNGFIYDKGTLTLFAAPQSVETLPESLNDLTQVAGQFTDPNFKGHVFIRQPNGTFSDLGVIGENPSADSINNQGRVLIGTFDGARVHTFISRPGSQSMEEVPSLVFGASVFPACMNHLGVVLGSAAVDTADSREHAYVYFNGKIKDLGLLPGGDDTFGNGINNLNQTCGEAFTASKPIFNNMGQHVGDTPAIHVAWVNVDGKLRDMNKLLNQGGKGWTLLTATSINDLGRVVAEATFKDGLTHAVELTPNCVLPNLVP